MASFITIAFNPKNVVKTQKGEITLRIPHQNGYEHALTLAGTKADTAKEAASKPARNVINIGVRQSTAAISKY